MKKILLLIIPALLLSLSAYAGKDNHIEVRNPAVKKAGNQVEVSFELVASEWNSNYKMTLTPLLHNEKGELLLEPVTVVGRKKDITDQRIKVNGGRRIVMDKNTPMPYRYTVTVPYEEWMQRVSVSVGKIKEGCCQVEEITSESLAENKLLYYDLVPHFSTTLLDYELTELEKYDLDNPFLHPTEDHAKRYEILVKDRDKGTSMFIFKVSSHVIDMALEKNREVIKAVSKSFELINNDPNAKLKHIMIAGYASPEGALSFNTKLAENRALAVKKLFQSIISDLDDGVFEIYNGREDWGGLREKVENSTMPEKRAVLEIIDSYSMEQEIRKTKLKQLDGGAPYRYMLENFYPDLRCAGYVQVYYEIDRRATVATAVTNKEGRTTWVDPDSPQNRAVTAINKAVELMSDNRFAEALTLLETCMEEPKAFNALGVCYMMTGKYDQAETSLRKAIAAGDQYAPRNLEELQTIREVSK